MPYCGAGGLVDRQQERRDPELVDEEVRDADLGRARLGERVRRIVLRRAAAPARPAASASGVGLLRPCRSATRCWRCRRPGWPRPRRSSSSWSWSCRPACPSSCRCRVSLAAGVAVGAGSVRGRRSAVGSTVTVGARGRRRRRRGLGRAEVDDRGDRRGQARDLDLIDRRAGRDLDRDRELLAGDQRHAHVVHLGVRGGHEHARVERGSGERDGERAAGSHGTGRQATSILDDCNVQRRIVTILAPFRRSCF